MGAMVKELCEQVVEVRRVNNRVIALVLFFKGDVLRLSCECALKRGRSLAEKNISNVSKDDWDADGIDPCSFLQRGQHRPPLSALGFWVSGTKVHEK